MLNLPVHIAPAPGTYLLLMRLKGERTITVGKLGTLEFKPGWYAYTGSAMGPGGVAARVRRHYTLEKKAHWHMDYLRPAVHLEGLFMATGRRIREHAWAQRLGRPTFGGQPINRFGSTDCRCNTHLFHFARRPNTTDLEKALKAPWISLGSEGHGLL